MKILITTLSALILTGSALAFPDGAKVKKDDAAVIAEQLPSYPTDECLVSGEPLAEMGEPVDLVHEGRLVRFCCKKCVKGFKKDPAKVLAKLDALVVEKQKASYPLDTCPVSGEKLGEMGEPLDYVHGTRLVRFCCKSCVKAFKKDPAATMAKVDQALIAQQLKSYPLSTCPLSGEEIGDDGENLLYGTELVRFCCPKCKSAFKKDPQKFLAKVHEAKKMAKTKEKKGI